MHPIPKPTEIPAQWTQPGREAFVISGRWVEAMRPGAYEELREIDFDHPPEPGFAGQIWRSQLLTHELVVCWYDPHPRPKHPGELLMRCRIYVPPGQTVA